VLTITAAGHNASIHLFGQYVAAGFHVTGSAQNVMVTYTNPSGHLPADTALAHNPIGH
jgi:hypothetical protein